MPRIRYALVIAAVAALLVPVTAIATAKGEGSKGASKSGQAERLRQIEHKRLQALVDADVAVAGALIASDFERPGPTRGVPPWCPRARGNSQVRGLPSVGAGRGTPGGRDVRPAVRTAAPGPLRHRYAGRLSA